MTTWFTSDHHFGHANIIKLCKRPFANVEEMDAEMIRRWNAVVTEGDTVWHLGDLTLGSGDFAQEILNQLNGTVRLLAMPWHHDGRWLLPGTRTILDKANVRLENPLVVLDYPGLGDGKYPLGVTLCHYPLAVWDRKHYGAWHLHGHSHGTYHADGKIIDVGVDNWDFTPVSLEEIIERMAAL